MKNTFFQMNCNMSYILSIDQITIEQIIKSFSKGNNIPEILAITKCTKNSNWVVIVCPQIFWLDIYIITGAKKITNFQLYKIGYNSPIDCDFCY